MNCERARELLQDGYDGIVTAGDRELLQAHLRGCEACRVYHQQMDAVIAGLDALRDVTTISMACGGSIGGGSGSESRSGGGSGSGSVGGSGGGSGSGSESRSGGGSGGGSGSGRAAAVKWMSRRLPGLLRIAAVLALAATAALFVRSRMTPRRRQPAGTVVATGAVSPSPAPVVRLMAGSRKRLIPVQRPTGNPRVHLVWLYNALPKPVHNARRSPDGKPLGVDRIAPEGSGGHEPFRREELRTRPMSSGALSLRYGVS